MSNILGVSIGTRNVGVAVIKLRMLTDYRIRTFPGKWTPKKCTAIKDLLRPIIERDEITDLSLKIPPPSHCSPNIQDLIRSIEQLCAQYHIQVHQYTIQEIKMSYTDAPKSNKYIVISALIDKYPILHERWKTAKQSQRYNAKLFEAIACAEQALRAGH